MAGLGLLAACGPPSTVTLNVNLSMNDPGGTVPMSKARAVILLELPSLELCATARSPSGTPEGSVAGRAPGATGGLACS
jgi:hypothetical protein